MLERDWIRRILAGDSEAFADVVRLHQVKVLGLCRALLGNKAQAEDAAQDVFVKAFRSLKSFRQDAAFSTWLYRIATNHCQDLLRQKARQKTESLDALLESAPQTRLQESAPDPRDSLITADAVQKYLSLLTPEERAILTLREVQQLSYKEIAEVLNCSLDAVKARLKRARQSLEEKTRHFSGF